MMMTRYERISYNNLLKDKNHMPSARPPNGDNNDNVLAREEISEEDTEDNEDRGTTQTDTDESEDEMRQSADYVEHVDVRSRFLHDSDISDMRRILT